MAVVAPALRRSVGHQRARRGERRAEGAAPAHVKALRAGDPRDALRRLLAGDRAVAEGAALASALRGAARDEPDAGACARRLKGARPEYAIESQVTLTANPDVPYQTVIAVMDALRSDDAGELFPAVHFGVAR